MSLLAYFIAKISLGTCAGTSLAHWVSALRANRRSVRAWIFLVLTFFGLLSMVFAF